MKPQAIVLLLLLLSCCAHVDDTRIAATLEYGNDQECIAFFQQYPHFVNYEMHGFINLPWSITVAAMHGKTKTIQYLIAHGADIGSADANGYTALHAAAREGHIDTVGYLLKQGVGVNFVKKTHVTRDEYGQMPAGEYGPSPLTAAARGKSTEMLQFLLKAGANINGTPPEPLNSPLHAALSSYNKDTIEMLLSKGADPTIVDGDGKSALDYANEYFGNSDSEMVSLIRQAIANWKSQHKEALGGSAEGRRR